MPKVSKTITPIHKPKEDRVFWIYIGKRRYDLFMSKVPFVFTPDFKQLKLLKNGNI